MVRNKQNGTRIKREKVKWDQDKTRFIFLCFMKNKTGPTYPWQWKLVEMDVSFLLEAICKLLLSSGCTISVSSKRKCVGNVNQRTKHSFYMTLLRNLVIKGNYSTEETTAHM